MQLKTIRNYCLAAIFLCCALPAHAQSIKPLEIEPDGNGVDMLSGKVSTKMQPVAIPAASNLSLDRISNIQPFLRGTLVASSNKSNYQINGGGSTSESFDCTDADCTSTKENGSGLLPQVIQPADTGTFTYMQGGSGKTIFFNKKSSWYDDSSGTHFSFYPDYVQYASGEKHDYTYQTFVPSPLQTIYRPSIISSNLGYEMHLTYQSNTGGTSGWGTVATATIYKTGDTVNALAQNTYSSTGTVTDLLGRTWSCCSTSLSELPRIVAYSMKLPTETADSYKAEAGTFSNGTQTGILTAKVTSDGTVWDYDYDLGPIDPSTSLPRIDKVDVTGPDNFSREVQISHPGIPGTRSPYIAWIKNSLGQQTDYAYDNFGRLVGVTMPEGNSVNVVYDSQGNIIEKRSKPKTTGTDIVETAYYDTLGICSLQIECFRPDWTKDAAGNQTDYTWNASGFLLTMLEPADVNGNRRKTINEYTTFNRKTKETTCAVASGGSDNCTTADAVVKTYTYWQSTFLPATETLTNGDASLAATTTYTYDNAGRVLIADGPLSGTGDAVYSHYDVIGRKIWEIGPQGASGTLRTATKTTYRAADSKPTLVETGTVSDPNNPASSFVLSQSLAHEYDANRNLAKSAVSASGTTETVSQFSYDARNQLDCTATRMNKAVFGSLPGACTLGTAGTEGSDRISRNTYDVLGRITKTVSGFGALGPGNAGEIDIELGYTVNGQIASRKDGNGNQTSYAYDGFDRLANSTFPDSSTEVLTYDSRSNILTLKKRAGQIITNTYDNASRLTQSSYSNGDPTVIYVYDGLGRETTLTRTGVSTLNYTYDDLGRMASTTQDGKTLTYEYDIAGRRTKLTHPDSFYITYDYSPAAQLLTIKENGAATLVTYAYDGLGRATSLTRANGVSTSLTYDPISRLASYSHSNLVTGSFTYNPSSQLTTRTVSNTAFTYKALVDRNLAYNVNNLNQYTTATGTTPATFAHDLNGNMTSDGAGTTYSYDALNRLTSASGTHSATLTYGPKGKLISIASGGTASAFLYDGDALIAQYDGSGTLTDRYVHGAGVDNPLVWYEGAGTATKSYLTTDERGSIIGITDSNGSTDINAYDEWGVPSGSNIGRFQYTGQMWIDELGLYYYKARIYAPRLGRFLQTDPIGYEDGMNLYAYVGNDPIMGVDPTGTTRCMFVNCGNSGPEGIEGVNAFANYTLNDNRRRRESGLKPLVTVTHDPTVKASEKSEGNTGSKTGNMLGNLPGNIGRGLKGALGCGFERNCSDYTKVGRWMSQAEADAMIKTGMVQRPYNGTDQSYVTVPPSPDSFRKQAPKGSIFVTYKVLSNRVYTSSDDNFAYISTGPNSLRSRYDVRRGLPAHTTPSARNIWIWTFP